MLLTQTSCCTEGFAQQNHLEIQETLGGFLWKILALQCQIKYQIGKKCLDVGVVSWGLSLLVRAARAQRRSMDETTHCHPIVM